MNFLRWQRANWPTTGRLADLRDELDRFLEAPLSRTTQLFGGWTPALDVHETQDSFVIRAELPGLKREDIDVSLQDGVLTISGERKLDKKEDSTSTYRTERYYGKFQRSVTLPVAVATDNVQAQYKDGVLSVTLPKTEDAKRKQIKVNIN